MCYIYLEKTTLLNEKARRQKHIVEPVFGLIAHPVSYHWSQNANSLTSFFMLGTGDTVVHETQSLPLWSSQSHGEA